MTKREQTVEDYVAERSAPVQKTLKELSALVESALPKSTLGIKWGAPVFTNAHGTPVIYLYGGKNHANLGFVRGAELDDPTGLLKGSGKAGRHVKIYPDVKMPKPALKALIRQCKALE